MAKSSSPSSQESQQLIALLNSGKLSLAEQNAKKLTAHYPNNFMVHHILALACDGQQKYAESITSYQHAIKLNPSMPELHFNLGIALTNTNQLDAAANAYKQAIQLNKNFFEAHGSLGIVYQRLGKLNDAINSYQNGLQINAQDAQGHFNLGTALRDKGDLQAAIKSYNKAIALFPNYTDAYNNLGETLRDSGDMDAAVKQYQQALSRNPDHPNANYNMGEFLYLAKKYSEAVPFFERSQYDDWQARAMYCLYKAERFDDFKNALDQVSSNAPHTSPLIATLATHYGINFDKDVTYNFCNKGLDFVYQNSINTLAEPDSILRKAILEDIENPNIAERVQGMLHYGKQSAGNLFKRPESSFQQLSTLIIDEFRKYQTRFANADCQLIQGFPVTLDFTSSWFVKMQQGGHLSPHIHEIGWISGAVYLKMPELQGDEGAFEYGTHGDDYPIASGKSHADFPKASVLPKVGDIVLFPSSLFHRTIPFTSNDERICIAFDLKPA